MSFNFQFQTAILSHYKVIGFETQKLPIPVKFDVEHELDLNLQNPRYTSTCLQIANITEIFFLCDSHSIVSLLVTQSYKKKKYRSVHLYCKVCLTRASFTPTMFTMLTILYYRDLLHIVFLVSIAGLE